MLINHDYSYTDKALIDAGYATIGLHSLVFDKYFTEEEKVDNRKFADRFGTNSPEWSNRCEKSGEEIYNQMEKVMEIINSHYKIYQYKDKGLKYGEHDLFFNSNRGFNQEKWYDHMSLSFNGERVTESNYALLEEIVLLLNKFETKNVVCRVQYKTIINEEKLNEDTLKICKLLEGKMIDYKGSRGKIRPINSETNVYGFFKKGASKYYYELDKKYIVLVLAS